MEYYEKHYGGYQEYLDFCRKVTKTMENDPLFYRGK
jgi:hypothetical protein